jgi:hypothetical protein
VKRAFRVSVRETWVQHFLVEAESGEEAVALVKGRTRTSTGALSGADKLKGPVIVPDGIDFLGAGSATARLVRSEDGRGLEPARRT